MTFILHKRVVALLALLIGGCGSSGGTAAVDAGASGSAGKDGGFALGGAGGASAGGSGGNSGAGGTTELGGSGGTDAGLGGSAGSGVATGGAGGGGSGGVAGIGGSGGAAGAASTCTDCVLVRAGNTFDGNVFVAAQGRIYWDHDINDPLHSVSTTGAGFGSYGGVGCGQTRRHARVHGDYIYYLWRHNDATQREIVRMKLNDPLAPCEVVFKPGYVINGGSFALDVADGAIYFNHRPDTSNSHTLAKLDLTTLKTTDISASRIEPDFSNATLLFGSTNLAGGSISFHVVQAPKTTGIPTDLATYQGSPTVIGADATWIYFTTGGTLNGVLQKLPINSAAPVTPTPIAGPKGHIYADGADVVWHEYGGSTLSRMAMSGGAITTKSLGSIEIHSVTWDAQNYYVMTTGSFQSDLYSVPR